jgi:hypothetical protein
MQIRLAVSPKTLTDRAREQGGLYWYGKDSVMVAIVKSELEAAGFDTEKPIAIDRDTDKCSFIFLQTVDRLSTKQKRALTLLALRGELL